jgi:hypothetical protein
MDTNDSGDARAMTRTLSRRSWLSGVWGNPMARGADRWHAGLRMLFIAIWIVALPAAATLGSLIAAEGMQAAQSQSHRTPATAVLTTDAPKVRFTAYGMPVQRTSDVPARWYVADGTARIGVVPAQAGAVSGTEVPIWLDDSGRPVDPPISSGAALGLGIGIGVGAWVGLGVLLFIALRCSVAALDRSRRADWERDWARVAPLWLPQP